MYQDFVESFEVHPSGETETEFVRGETILHGTEPEGKTAKRIAQSRFQKCKKRKRNKRLRFSLKNPKGNEALPLHLLSNRHRHHFRSKNRNLRLFEAICFGSGCLGGASDTKNGTKQTKTHRFDVRNDQTVKNNAIDCLN